MALLGFGTSFVAIPQNSTTTAGPVTELSTIHLWRFNHVHSPCLHHQDLKKQTALRLAQEQQQTEFFPSLALQRRDEASVLAERFCHNGLQPPGSDPSYILSEHPRNSYYPSEQPRTVGYRPASNTHKTNELHMPVEMTTLQPQAQPGIIYPRPQAPGLVNHSFESPLNSKSKLPHGLTVQELKEMTKARLDEQRRRSYPKSKKKQHYQQSLATGRHEPPLDVRENQYNPMDHHVPQQRGPPVTHNNSMNHGYVQQERVLASPSHGYAAASERVLASPSHGLLPGPPGFQSLPSQGSLVSGLDSSQIQSFCHGDGSWQQQQLQHHSNKDAWETGSVASHNSTINSEFLGSEYNMDEFGEIPFHRTRSYPSGPRIGSSDRNYEAPLSMIGYYDPGLTPNQNRRRAATLSPRSGLSYLHEDRPSFSGVAELNLPMDPLPHTPITIRHSPVLPNRTRIYSDNGAIGGDFNCNRPRTSSAPTISSFYSMTNEMFSGLSSMTGASGLEHNELPNSMVESILDDSNNILKPDNADFSPVFRNFSPQNTDHAGFMNPWGGESLARGTERRPRDFDQDTALAIELDSVLSLSGIHASSDSFSPRRSPQVSIFPSLGSTSDNGSTNNSSNQYHHMNGIHGTQPSFRSRDAGRGF